MQNTTKHRRERCYNESVKIYAVFLVFLWFISLIEDVEKYQRNHNEINNKPTTRLPMSRGEAHDLISIQHFVLLLQLLILRFSNFTIVYFLWILRFFARLEHDNTQRLAEISPRSLQFCVNSLKAFFLINFL